MARISAAVSALALGATLATSLGGCSGSTASPTVDGGNVEAHQLSLGFSLGAPALAGLELTAGMLELERVSVFGDVAADERTVVRHFLLSVPKDKRDQIFPDAPFGLYSRVQAGPLELHAQGSWRGTPLDIDLENTDLSVDLRGAALDYSPEQSARFEIVIDAGAWFDAAALDDARVSFGKIRVSSTQNTDLAASIVSGMRGSVTLASAPTAL
jgi:hypothetical protein